VNKHHHTNQQRVFHCCSDSVHHFKICLRDKLPAEIQLIRSIFPSRYIICLFTAESSCWSLEWGSASCTQRQFVTFKVFFIIYLSCLLSV